MSAGPFLNAFYESDTGEIHNIRIQPETASLVIGTVTNTIPAGPANNDQQVRVSAGRGSIGIKARKIRFEMLTDTATNPIITAGNILELPWLQPDTFLTATRPGKQTGTYQGGNVRVVGGTPETFTG